MIPRPLAVTAVVLALMIPFIWGSILVMAELAQQRDDDWNSLEDLDDLHW